MLSLKKPEEKVAVKKKNRGREVKPKRKEVARDLLIETVFSPKQIYF